MLHLLQRPRRLRASPVLREIVRETRLHPAEYMLPFFVSEKISSPQPVASMPGVCQWPLDQLPDIVGAAHADGVRSIILFGIPSEKDETASGAYAEEGIIQRALQRLKPAFPELLIATDVCLCEYMAHGHCGITHRQDDHYTILNDPSVDLLVRTALSHAAAGADIVAPSDMMDGRIGAIRHALDAAGFTSTILMSYAAKFASAFYGPFRDAGESAPRFGDRHSYQMDPANQREALREVALDIEQGADIVMVKPGLAYLDILAAVKANFGFPTATYCVSGEYAMIKAAAERGWLDEKAVVLEMMTAFKRAGADLVLTYWAHDIVRWLRAS